MPEQAAASYETISADDAERFVRDDAVRVVDVRTSEEFELNGHIPGAALLPVDLIAVAPATLARDGKPLLITCEHGIRSAHAARFLAEAGFSGVLNMAGGMSCWKGPREHSQGEPYGPTGPSSWLMNNADLLAPGSTALDVACGRGRHALLLASAGITVRALDRDGDLIGALRADAARLRLPVSAEVVDLETDSVDLGRETVDLVLVIHYLHRPLFGALISALRPGGLLLYETFTVDQAARGGPRNPDHLLKHGELETLAAPLEVLRRREGEYEGRMVSAIAARKPRR